MLQQPQTEISPRYFALIRAWGQGQVDRGWSQVGWGRGQVDQGWGQGQVGQGQVGWGWGWGQVGLGPRVHVLQLLF